MDEDDAAASRHRLIRLVVRSWYVQYRSRRGMDLFIDNSLSTVQNFSAGNNGVETFKLRLQVVLQVVSVTILGMNEPIELSEIETSVDAGGFVLMQQWF